MKNCVVACLGPVILVLSGVTGSLAQIPIPDPYMQTWLNMQVPGIVSAEGIMDIGHPGIAAVTFTGITLPLESEAPIDLEGLQYLTALSTFNVTGYGSTELICQNFPSSLNELNVMVNADVVLGILPATMEKITLNSDVPATYAIGQLPVQLQTLWLRVEQAHWPAGANVYNMGVFFEGTSFTLPPCNVQIFQTMGIPAYQHRVDLSAASIWVIGAYDLWGDTLAMPSGTVTLDVGGFEHLEQIPPSLNQLMMIQAPRCLPWLPQGIEGVSFEEGIPECKVNWPSTIISWYPSGLPDLPTCSILTSDCPDGAPGLSGRIFLDLNANGQYDPNEPGLPQITLLVQPGAHTAGPDLAGHWTTQVSAGAYTIIPAPGYPYIQSVTPQEHQAFLSQGGMASGNDFAVTLIPDVRDLRASITAGVARPGFHNQVHITCQNHGTMAAPAQVNLEFAANQSWSSSSVPPTTIVGNTIIWDLGQLELGETQSVIVDLYTAPSVPLGTPILHTLTANPVAGDETPADNIVLWVDTVIGSYDPNDKLITPAALTATEVANGETPIDYTIRFQNTGTYLAERVVILDTLPAGLVLESIQFLAGSHANHWYVTDGVLHVIHNDIMLPDSTSDEANSHGHVKFRIMPSTDLQEGQQLFNIAHIVFDFNEPIITPPAVFTVQTPMSVHGHAVINTTVFPNPVRNHLWITGMQGATPFRIRDVHGRTVRQGTLGQDRSMDVSELGTGVYVIELMEQSGVRPVRFMKE